MSDPRSRGVFDVRLHITGADEPAVLAAVAEFLEQARLVAPPEVHVAYWQIRPPGRSRTFAATMGPKRRRDEA